MKRILLPLIFISSMTACTAPSKTVSVLENQGFTNIQTHGYAFFGCSEDDTFATKFTAISPAGKEVSGVVCSGLLKGATIRFD